MAASSFAAKSASMPSSFEAALGGRRSLER
jgi:hypothetical protein